MDLLKLCPQVFADNLVKAAMLNSSKELCNIAKPGICLIQTDLL